MTKMREAIIAIAVLFVISAAFSYSYIPQIASGDFNVFSQIDNANKSDFVLLLPPNWSIKEIQYSGNMTNKEILLKNLYGKEYLALHLSFNSNNVYIRVLIHPTSNGYVYMYNIKDNGYAKRKVEYVKIIPNTKIIPFLLLTFPFLTFFIYKMLKERTRSNRRKDK